MTDPYEAGPPEYQPDEEPGDDDRALWAEAAAELAEWMHEWRTHEGPWPAGSDRWWAGDA